ncbi:MAG: ABC transporter ATP-binding protein [Xanthomonadales bacterium]|nr:ABC transporter ATP-binding protein [Xanthomonadales bacterium]
MIEINQLSLKIENKTLIKNLSLQLNKGDFWAIVARNGIGKTTLLKTIAGFTSSEPSCVKIKGRNITEYSVLERAQNISYLSQLQDEGLDCTVKQAVSYGRYPWHKFKLDNSDETKLIKKALMDMDLQDLQNRSLKKLSGGELRKVDIATILAQNSEIMILDEPLNHLDVAFRYHLMKLLKNLSQKKLIIMVTHDIQYVKEYCSHVLMISNKGKGISGKVSEIMTAENVKNILEIEPVGEIFESL